jgi:hypothetical protein
MEMIISSAGTEETDYSSCLEMSDCIKAMTFCKVSQNYWTKRKHDSMYGAQEQGSEVARLLKQISMEYEAAQRGLFGLASGTSKHAFITQKMENMELYRQELQHIVGEMPAIAMIAEQLDACGDTK